MLPIPTKLATLEIAPLIAPPILEIAPITAAPKPLKLPAALALELDKLEIAPVEDAAEVVIAEIAPVEFAADAVIVVTAAAF